MGLTSSGGVTVTASYKPEHHPVQCFPSHVIFARGVAMKPHSVAAAVVSVSSRTPTATPVVQGGVQEDSRQHGGTR
ncbi:hypothetical protein [Planotetraspora kaengkrachanensis]|uniref:Uncharacterized protein n=1 Tax=Planotetraspora kaengkrachanensis TaxID=575193 RepID=A0A8J3M3P9_9ACTN|nr:hypothetical protein [Planotetraspora kaengkrachanensis]GIG78595.1 hypothetical protein Pka01_17220 [Planotetraspora kaengkrachanensis]